MCGCAIVVDGVVFFYVALLLQAKKARWRETLLLSCALLLPVFGGVWVCQDCCSLYVDLAVFGCVSVACRSQWRSERMSLRGKGRDGRQSALWAGVIHSLQ